jgi:putative endonuclease
MAKQYYVYILTNRTYTALYVGVTNDIQRRMHEHLNGLLSGFTRRYNVTMLVCCEVASDARDALRREKQIKGWTRAKKIELIESQNPEWRDLAEDWAAPPTPQILRASE